MKHDSYPKLFFASAKDLAVFLEKEHDKIPGIWLKLAKKNSGVQSITHDEAIETILCYGWIDGQAASFDETYHLLKITPRGPRSLWSQRNINIVERLIKEKRLRPSGLQKVEEAKADGRWERAYGGSKDAVIPEDFLKELKKNIEAYEFYLTLNKSNLFVIYYRLQTRNQRASHAGYPTTA